MMTPSTRTSHLWSRLSSFACAAALVAGCSSSSSSGSAECTAASCSDASPPLEGGGRGDATAETSTDPGCAGMVPLCFGNDITQCCGQDPWMSATCVDGAWMCDGAPAPGCNGRGPLDCDAGTTDTDAAADAPSEGD